jgi:hypothetical protein
VTNGLTSCEIHRRGRGERKGKGSQEPGGKNSPDSWLLFLCVLGVQIFSAARVRSTKGLSRSPLPLRLKTLVAKKWPRHAGLTLK